MKELERNSWEAMFLRVSLQRTREEAASTRLPRVVVHDVCGYGLLVAPYVDCGPLSRKPEGLLQGFSSRPSAPGRHAALGWESNQ